MKLYFLLEDSKSFCKVLPFWLTNCLPRYKQVNHEDDLCSNSYLLESGAGYPRIKKVLKERLNVFVKYNVQLDYIAIFYDVDEWKKDKIQSEQLEYDEIFKNEGKGYNYELFPIYRCFETWLLGNRKVFPQVVDKSFKGFANFYDVSQNDPEMMSKPDDYEDTLAYYHYRYLQQMLKSSIKKNYSKRHPGVVTDADYLESLIQRTEDTDDMASFNKFIIFLQRIKMKL